MADIGTLSGNVTAAAAAAASQYPEGANTADFGSFVNNEDEEAKLEEVAEH